MTGEENRKGMEAVTEGKYPEGLRVLVVDDNLICQKILEQHLRRCKYQREPLNLPCFSNPFEFMLYEFSMWTVIVVLIDFVHVQWCSNDGDGCEDYVEDTQGG